MCRVSERNAAGEENSTGEDETTVAGAMLPDGGLPLALAATPGSSSLRRPCLGSSAHPLSKTLYRYPRMRGRARERPAFGHACLGAH